LLSLLSFCIPVSSLSVSLLFTFYLFVPLLSLACVILIPFYICLSVSFSIFCVFLSLLLCPFSFSLSGSFSLSFLFIPFPHNWLIWKSKVINSLSLFLSSLPFYVLCLALSLSLSLSFLVSIFLSLPFSNTNFIPFQFFLSLLYPLCSFVYFSLPFLFFQLKTKQ
jgi:hypothetical protein